MNCKPGDRAYVIHSESGNEGKICTVLRRSTKPGLDWYVEFTSPVYWRNGEMSRFGHGIDEHLLPIKFVAGVDEMVTLVGKPDWNRLKK